jgi:hypothetical protein
MGGTGTHYRNSRSSQNIFAIGVKAKDTQPAPTIVEQRV